MALTPLAIIAAQPQPKPYRLNDGRSLFVVVHPSGSKSFEFRYRRDGKLRAIVLGGCKEMGLKDARDERDRLRAKLADGLDPLAQRRIAAEEQQAKLAVAKATAAARKVAATREALTVKVVADAWVADTRSHWTAKHADQVEQSLRDHVYPDLGSKPIAEIEPGDILDLLGKLLADSKVETARRVRQRLDAVFERAGLKHKLVANPVAVAKREINKRVKAANKANPAANFPCVPTAEVPQLLRAMRAYVGTPITRSLLWFVAMTGCRTGEARYAVWSEFNFDDARWIIPAGRMKARREHLVPLAPAVAALLVELKKVSRAGSFVFAHPRRDDRPASENAILYALAAIGFKDRMSGHGFRQLFSTSTNESGQWRPDVIEAALAHKEGDEVRGAYNKAAYLDERRRLMNWWCDELARLEAGTPAKTVHIKQTAA
jgi:integrase